MHFADVYGYSESMTVKITIRDVPETVRDELARRAASNRQSMQAFILGELERIAKRPSNADLMKLAGERVARAKTSIGSDAIVKMIRERRGT